MAVSAELKVYPAAEITAQDFAIMMEHITPDISGVLYGCGVTIQDSNTIHVNAGWALVRGRLVKINEGTLDVTLPSSGSGTRYVILTVNLDNNTSPTSVSIMDSVPSDTTNFNVVSGSAYLELASFTVSSTRASSMKTATAMHVVSNKTYHTTVSFKYGPNKSGGCTINLYRYQRLVYCRFQYVGDVKGSDVGKTVTIKSDAIPAGYRPVAAAIIPYLQVVNNSMAGAGRGQWIINSNGGVSHITNTSAFIERIGSASWITEDGYPY